MPPLSTPGLSMSKSPSFRRTITRTRTLSKVKTQGGTRAFLIDEEELSEKYVIRHQYDPQDTARNMLSFHGTVIDMVLNKPHFWLLIVMNLLFFLGWMYASEFIRETINEYWVLRQAYYDSLTSLVVFSIVFYTGNCYATYKDLFNFGMDVQTHVIVLASHLKAILHSGEEVWGSIRFFLAAQRVYYYELKMNMAKHSGLKEGEKGHPGTWKEWTQTNIIKHGILTAVEVKILSDFEGNKQCLLASWGESAFHTHAGKNPRYDKLSPPAKSQYLGRFMTASEKLQTLLLSTTNTKQFGVPFVYHHIVHVICTLFLILQSGASMFLEPADEVCFWSLITYPIICFVMLGILSAADSMADPFGEDDCDFNLEALTQRVLSDISKLCAVDDTPVMAQLHASSQSHEPPSSGATGRPIADAQPLSLGKSQGPSSGSALSRLGGEGTKPVATAELFYVQGEELEEQLSHRDSGARLTANGAEGEEDGSGGPEMPKAGGGRGGGFETAEFDQREKSPMQRDGAWKERGWASAKVVGSGTEPRGVSGAADGQRRGRAPSKWQGRRGPGGENERVMTTGDAGRADKFKREKSQKREGSGATDGDGWYNRFEDDRRARGGGPGNAALWQGASFKT